MNIDLLHKLLIRAGHPGTPDLEAVASARKAYQLLDQAGQSFSSLNLGSAAVYLTLDEHPAINALDEAIQELGRRVLEQHEEMRAFRKQKRELVRANKALKEENRRLKAELSAATQPERRATVEPDVQQAPEAPTSDTGRGFVEWATFQAAAEAAYGRSREWIGVFGLAAGLPIKRVMAWRTTGYAPASWLDLLKDLTPEQRAKPSRRRWDPPMVARLQALVEGSTAYSDFEIASILSAEFGRLVTETNITGRRRRGLRAGWKRPSTSQPSSEPQSEQTMWAAAA
jgi:hypothetical protein